MEFDSVTQAWQAIARWAEQVMREMAPALRQLHRILYYAGADIPPPGYHPMTARKMRGAIRRLRQSKP